MASRKRTGPGRVFGGGIMIYGIIGAMPEEVEALKKVVTGLRTEKAGTVEYCAGVLGGKSVVVACSGIGKVAAATAAAVMIAKFGAGAVVNTGVAGGLGPEVKILDVVVGTGAAQHDFDLTAFGYAKGQLPGFDRIIPLDPALARAAAAAAEAVAARYGFGVHRGAILSGDQFIAGAEIHRRLAESFPGARATEMEGAAVAQAAAVLGVPCAVVRTISDNADDRSGTTFAETLPIATRNSQEITLELLKRI